MKRSQPPWVWLVAGAILVLLAFIIFMPVNVDEGEVTPGKVCFSNIRQLVLGAIMYSTDADDRAPLHDTWMEGIQPYTKSEQIFHCPAMQNKEDFGYAFNSGVQSLSDKNPYLDTTPLIYDSMNPARNASDPFGSLPTIGRHDGKNNIAYASGHAKSVATASK